MLELYQTNGGNKWRHKMLTVFFYYTCVATLAIVALTPLAAHVQ